MSQSHRTHAGETSFARLYSAGAKGRALWSTRQCKSQYLFSVKLSYVEFQIVFQGIGEGSSKFHFWYRLTGLSSDFSIKMSDFLHSQFYGQNFSVVLWVKNVKLVPVRGHLAWRVGINEAPPLHRKG